MKRLIFASFMITGLFADVGVRSWNFEDVQLGSLPKGWHTSATHPKKPMAVWKVIKSDEPSRKQVLSLTKANDSFLNGGIFNLCYTKSVDFKDGEIDVMFKANSGHTDQGGGIMWRVQDDNNYYVVRFNPLEDNFRFYIVKDGHRHELASANVKLAKGWHEMQIAQNGDDFKASLDGKKLLSFTDSQLPKSGGVGVWTKSDAATSFDDFSVKVVR